MAVGQLGSANIVTDHQSAVSYTKITDVATAGRTTWVWVCRDRPGL